MVGRAALLPLVLWISTANAFYPWLPHSICVDDSELCKAQTASVGSTQEERSLPASSVNEGLRFKIGRKTPAAQSQRDEPLKHKVERMADRLAKKHSYPSTGREHTRFRGRRQPLAPTPTADSKLAKRTNTYSIATAATPSATNAVGIDQDGTDFSYFVEAKFGDKDAPMLMLLDTGAGTTWVMGTDCGSTACSMHSSFGPDDSTTLKTSSDAFSIAYGSGSVSGNLASDTLSLAALSLTMSIGLADTASSDFTYFPFDGILGMSRSEGSTDNFLSSVSDAKLLPANIFGVSLWRESDGGENNGEVMFGAVDSSKYTGSISYTAASSSSDWSIPMDDIGYDGGKAGVTGRTAYIDTGTTYVFGPSTDVAALHKQIPGASSSDGVTYTVPCASNQPLTVHFSGVAYSISAADWLSSADGNGDCTSNIYGRAVVANAWLLGDLFIKNVYAVFDADEGRIGFASKPTATSTSSQASSSATGASSSSSGSSSGSSPGSSSAIATTTAAPSPSSSGEASLPGLSGHETPASALAESSSTSTAVAAKTTTVSSPADRVEGSIYVSVICVVAAIAMVA